MTGSMGGSQGTGDNIRFGNNHVGISITSGITTLGGNSDYSNTTLTTGFDVDNFSIRGGNPLGVGVGAEVGYTPDTGVFEGSISVAAGVKIDVEVSYEPGVGVNLESLSIGLGYIRGAHYETPWGAFGLSAEGSVGVTIDDEEGTHIGFTGDGHFSPATTSTNVEGHAGFAFDLTPTGIRSIDVLTVEQLRALNTIDAETSTIFDWEEAVERRRQQVEEDLVNDPRGQDQWGNPTTNGASPSGNTGGDNDPWDNDSSSGSSSGGGIYWWLTGWRIKCRGWCWVKWWRATNFDGILSITRKLGRRCGNGHSKPKPSGKSKLYWHPTIGF